MRSRCGPGRRGAPGGGWGGGAALRPGPRPVSAGAAQAFTASAPTPRSELHDVRGIARGLAPVRAARLPLEFCHRRMRLFARLVIPREFSSWGCSALSQPLSS